MVFVVEENDLPEAHGELDRQWTHRLRFRRRRCYTCTLADRKLVRGQICADVSRDALGGGM